MTDWTYQDKPISEEQLEGYKSFVYKIVYKPTGKAYIGKKTLISTNRKKVKGRVNRKIVVKPSNWLKYWGSNEQLVDDIETYGKENFERYILRFCKSKGEASYYEAKYQFMEDVLLKPDLFYNQHIMVHVHRGHLNGVA